MDYLPIILGFFSAIVALIGKTWDSSAAGYSKLTRTGWLTFLFILLTSGYSFLALHNKRIDRERVDAIVKHEILASLESLEDPVKTLYMDIQGGNYIEGLTMVKLLDPAIIEKMQSTCFFHTPKHINIMPNPGAWGDIFAAHIKAGMGRLDATVSNYAPHISADILVAIHDVTHHRFREYSKFTPGHFARLASEPSDIPRCFVTHSTGAFESYIGNLIKLRNSLEQ